jgi:hypothetical protein
MPISSAPQQVMSPPSRWCRVALRRLRGVHGDERGTISILAVFALLMFTLLLAMIMNVAFHADDKVKMQNAADASAYTGGVMLARGMNAIAFSNHLLCDVFAMTAFLREGRDRNISGNSDDGTESLSDAILSAWEEAGGQLSRSGFDKFAALGPAVIDMTSRAPQGRERRMVTAFVELTYAAQEYTLPVYEHILAEELIPKFQRAVILQIPQAAQAATHEIAFRHGALRRGRIPSNARNGSAYGRQPQGAVLWRTNVRPAGDLSTVMHPMLRAIPAIDPSATSPFNDYIQLGSLGQVYFDDSVKQRKRLARGFLEEWNADRLIMFKRDARMSMFYWLWRIATCTQLRNLLENDYPDTNLPIMLRRTDSGETLADLRRAGAGSTVQINRHLEREFDFVTVVYRDHLTDSAPGVFHNPLRTKEVNKQSDEKLALTFAQVRLFVPKKRTYWVPISHQPPPPVNTGGTHGSDPISPPMPLPPPGEDTDDPERYHWVTERWPQHWDLLNQNWSVQLVPATAYSIPKILQTPPDGVDVGNLFGGNLRDRLPNFGGLTKDDMDRINTH